MSVRVEAGKRSGALRAGRAAAVLLALFVLLQGLFGCDYARMKDDEAVNPYGAVMPDAPKNAVPTTGGVELLAGVSPDSLRNPLPDTQEVIIEGQLRYGYACVQCHGPRGDGNGTVGQSFAPVPADFGSPVIQKQSDGQLFVKTLFGYKRHPALASTITEEQAWAIIRFIRTIPKRG